MRALITFSFALTIVAGCSQSASSDEPPAVSAESNQTAAAKVDGEKAGSRLQPRYLKGSSTGADGSKIAWSQFQGWFDTQRNEACTVAAASDGKQRCLPSAISDTYVRYMDAECTKRIVSTSMTTCTPSQAPKYWTDDSAAARAAASCVAPSLRRVGAQVDPPALYIKGDNNDVCYKNSVMSGQAYFLAESTVVAPADFVEVTITQEVH